jgi:hypothetical protein
VDVLKNVTALHKNENFFCFTLSNVPKHYTLNEEMSDQLQSLAAFDPGKRPLYPLGRGLDEPSSCSGCVGEWKFCSGHLNTFLRD